MSAHYTPRTADEIIRQHADAVKLAEKLRNSDPAPSPSAPQPSDFIPGARDEHPLAPSAPEVEGMDEKIDGLFLSIREHIERGHESRALSALHSLRNQITARRGSVEVEDTDSIRRAILTDPRLHAAFTLGKQAGSRLPEGFLLVQASVWDESRSQLAALRRTQEEDTREWCGATADIGDGWGLVRCGKSPHESHVMHFDADKMLTFANTGDGAV